MKKIHKHATRNKKIADKLAEICISVAGFAVIAAMAAMLILIVREAAPLFMPASIRAEGKVAFANPISDRDVAALGVAADLRERARAVGTLHRDGSYGFATLTGLSNGTFSVNKLDGAPEDAKIIRAEPFGNGFFSVLWSDYTLSLVAMRVEFREDGDGGMAVSSAFETVFSIALDNSRGEPLYAMIRGTEDNHRAVIIHSDGTVTEKALRPGRGLRARGKGTQSERDIVVRRHGEIASAALSTDGGQLYLGTDGGDIIAVDLSGDADTALRDEITPAFRDRRAITSLRFLNGDYAVAVGDAEGGASVWFPRREEGEFRFRRSADWAASGGAVTTIAASSRDRGFFALGAEGGLRWLYSTSGGELAALPAQAEIASALALNDRSDTLAMMDSQGVSVYRLDSSYPEAGWTGFFKKLLYEGYETAAFVWQSTGSDASESKLSLVPLVWGSVKGAAYALFFATPIALAAAMYLSQFASPKWRARLKPAVEMLAAVPSVVIGFLAALWLAPLLERYVQPFLGGMPYDQRNSLVIAIAMGFAVIPTIFSLAEDAISAVPPALSAASLALGASKWQTVWRVVLPTASPGIFTAVMLGLGRAVGETMIVLMAAGNTPIISLSPFNGMRTLSANIAVEMPEAPVGGTLYRTLFLCALILFVLTLVINTAAEVFRHRLRRRYGRL